MTFLESGLVPLRAKFLTHREKMQFMRYLNKDMTIEQGVRIRT